MGEVLLGHFLYSKGFEMAGPGLFRDGPPFLSLHLVRNLQGSLIRSAPARGTI